MTSTVEWKQSAPESATKVDKAEPLYIVVEGPIGVGKTTLVRKLQSKINAQLLLEIVEENPFLANFYQDKERYAFQTQLFFLMSRFKQQKELEKQGKTNYLADYHLLKDRIFAELTLGSEELHLYETVYQSLSTCIKKPDVLIYLHADSNVLLRRIEKRNRPFEKNFDATYLDKLSDKYQTHFSNYQETPIIRLNTSTIDYVNHDGPINEILEETNKLISARKAGVSLSHCVSSNY
jgi:deoxyguanosine kinase